MWIEWETADGQSEQENKKLLQKDSLADRQKYGTKAGPPHAKRRKTMKKKKVTLQTSYICFKL